MRTSTVWNDSQPVGDILAVEAEALAIGLDLDPRDVVDQRNVPSRIALPKGERQRGSLAPVGRHEHHATPAHDHSKPRPVPVPLRAILAAENPTLAVGVSGSSPPHPVQTGFIPRSAG